MIRRFIKNQRRAMRQVRPASPAKSRLKTGLKVAAGVAVAGGALLAGRKLLSGGTGRRRRKRGAVWYAREIIRLKLKKRYDKIKIGV